MNKSTPINQIRGEQDNREAVDKILDEIEGGRGEDMMDQQQMPAQQDRYEPYGEQYEPQYEQRMMSTNERIISEVKEPLLVVLLVFITNFSTFNNLLIQYIPKLGEHGELNMLGLLLKAVIAGIVFYAVKKFVL